MNKYLQEMFAICNAGAYPERQVYFYPLKNKLLKKHGVWDGHDLQEIEHYCWNCEGTGIDEWHDRGQCSSCNGTGIYRTVEVVLIRYRLGNKVYHSPTDIPAVQVAPKIVIKGLVRHKQPDREEFIKALKILLFLYDFPSFYSLMYELYRDSKPGQATYWCHFSVRNLIERWFYTIAILMSGAMPLWDYESVEVTYKSFEKYRLFSWIISPYDRYVYQRYLQLRVNKLKWFARLCLLFTGWSLIKYNAQGLWCKYSSLDDWKYYKHGYPALSHLQWILNAYRSEK